jgi:hypothetical protein
MSVVKDLGATGDRRVTEHGAIEAGVARNPRRGAIRSKLERQ